MSSDERFDRRKFLKRVGAGGIAFGMAGCTSGGGGGDGADGGSSGGSGDGGSGGDASGGDSTGAEETATDSTPTQKSGTSGSQAESISIGAAIPNSGDLAVFGQRNQRGFDLALKDINSAKLHDGKELEVLVEDTQTAPQAGVSAARKLASQEGVPAILGAVSSGVTQAIAKSVTIPNEVVQVATASTSSAITELEDDNYILRTATSSALEGRALADLALENDVTTASFVYVNNAYGIGFADSMEEAFKSKGGTVASRVPYESGKSSYRPVLNKAMEGDPDGIVFVAYPKSFTTMIKQAYEMGLREKVTYLASDGIVADSVEENVPEKAINGLLGLNPTPPVESNVYQTFLDDFDAEYGKKPTIWTAYAYDAIMLTAIAIEAAGEVESTAIRDQIYGISRPKGTKVSTFSEAKAELEKGNDVNYEGASGSVDLTDAGDVPGTYRKFEVVGGAFEMGEFIEASSS